MLGAELYWSNAAVELLSVVRLDTAKVAVCVCRLLHIGRIRMDIDNSGVTGT
jgi:hypothetical protein